MKLYESPRGMQLANKSLAYVRVVLKEFPITNRIIEM